MPTDRSYSSGDRVVFLARGEEQHTGALQNFGPQHFTARSLQTRPFVLAEGIVTEVMDYADQQRDLPPGARRNSNMIYVKFQAEEHELYSQDFILSRRGLQNLENLANMGFDGLGMPAEQRAWLSQFIYPVVVSSQGYNRLLTDLLLLARPDADVGAVRRSDVQEIIAKAGEYGIRYVPIKPKYIHTKWAAQDRIEEPEQAPMKVKFVQVNAVARPWDLNYRDGPVYGRLPDQPVMPPPPAGRNAVWNPGLGIWIDEPVPQQEQVDNPAAMQVELDAHADDDYNEDDEE